MVPGTNVGSTSAVVISLPAVVGWLVSAPGTSFRNGLALIGELQLFSLTISLALIQPHPFRHLRHAHFSLHRAESVWEGVKGSRGVEGLESCQQKALPWESCLVCKTSMKKW